VTGGADAVTRGEQTFDGGHAVIAPEPAVRRAQVVLGGTGDPQTGAAGMRTQQIRLGGMISDGTLSGSMLKEAHRQAAEMDISRKSSQASASRC